MRLVDLLLTPRQTTSLPYYGGQARDGPLWTKQAPPPTPTPLRSPVYTAAAAATTHQNSDNLAVNASPRYYFNPHDSPVCGQVAQKSAPRSVGALSDLLRSTRSPTASLYRNHSTVTPNSQCVTTELSRLLQQQDSLHPEEILIPDNDGSQLEGGRIQEGSGAAQIRAELVTLDKNLNCTIWKNDHGVFRANSSSSSSASLSSASSSSSKSSSTGEPRQRVPAGRRRVSLLSSDGSDLDPPDHILSTMVDSDSHESLSSPLEEMEASRWMEQNSSTGGCYGDWQNLDEGEDKESYDIFDAYPLFNFNILGSSLDGADSPFIPLDSSNYLLTSDDNITFGNDSSVVTATDSGPKEVDYSLKQELSGCQDYKPFGVNSIAENMFQAQHSLANGVVRHQNINNSNSSSGETLFVAPSYSAAADNAPRSTATSPPQSEVVKLLLQNRPHQWAPPPEKLPPHGGYRGSRKRTQGSGARETTRAKAPRSSRLAPVSSERRHSVPSLTMKVNPFVSTTSLNLEDDQSASLERLITELILLESENAYSTNPSHPDSSADLKCSTWTSNPTTEHRGRDTEKLNAVGGGEGVGRGGGGGGGGGPFEDLIVCPTTSESDLFFNMELDSIYSSGDYMEWMTLQGAPRHPENIDVVIKPDPEQAESPSVPLHSTSSQECSFSFPANGFSRKSTLAFSTQYEQDQNGINGGKSDGADSASALEGVLQSKLFLDSPPGGHFDPTSECNATRGSDQAIADHDYCQTDSLLQSSPAVGLQTTDGSHGEPAWLMSSRRKQSKCCLSEGASDYSALKSLLLDSNLTEEVHKEAELVRAKSRRNMSEKRTPPPIVEPLRALRCGGKSVPDDTDDTLLSHLAAEGESPLRLLYKNLTALTGGQLSLKSLFEQLLSSDETSNLEAEDADATERLSSTAIKSESSDSSPDPDGALGAAEEHREESEDGALELSTPLTPHLDLCSADAGGGDIENAVFFDSFEEFYSSSGHDLESTVELQVDGQSESSSQSSMALMCESSRPTIIGLPTNTVNRWNFKRPRQHSLKKRTGPLLATVGRDDSRTRALRSGQTIKEQSTQVAAPLGCRVRSIRRKPPVGLGLFVDKRHKTHLHASKL